MSLAQLKTTTRAFAKVSHLECISDVDSLPSIVSDETMAIYSAIKDYSQARPRSVVQEFTGNSDYEFSLDSITAYSPETCLINAVFWPVERQSEYVVPADEWRVYQRPDGTWWLKLLQDSPSDKIWVRLTIPHDAATLITTAPADIEAICHLAASKLLQMAANYMASSTSSSIAADSVDRNQQSATYSQRSKDEKSLYNQWMTGRRQTSGARLRWGQSQRTDRPFWRER